MQSTLVKGSPATSQTKPQHKEASNNPAFVPRQDGHLHLRAFPNKGEELLIELERNCSHEGAAPPKENSEPRAVHFLKNDERIGRNKKV